MGCDWMAMQCVMAEEAEESATPQPECLTPQLVASGDQASHFVSTYCVPSI